MPLILYIGTCPAAASCSEKNQWRDLSGRYVRRLDWKWTSVDPSGSVTSLPRLDCKLSGSLLKHLQREGLVSVSPWNITHTDGSPLMSCRSCGFTRNSEANSIHGSGLTADTSRTAWPAN